VDITWKANNPTKGKAITIPPSGGQIASISGFLSRDENPNNRHIVFAQNKTGEIYDTAYPNEDKVGQHYVKTMSPALANIADITSFYSARDQLCHMVYATRDGNLYEITYKS
jgi:hypothetical protein